METVLDNFKEPCLVHIVEAAFNIGLNEVERATECLADMASQHSVTPFAFDYAEAI